MNRTIVIALCAALAPTAGCLGSDSESGPTVGITLSTDSGTASDGDGADAQLDFEGAATLSVQLLVNSQSGESSASFDSNFPVTQFSGTLSIPTTMFTQSDFTSDGNTDGPSFTSKQMITIPASAVDQTLTVTLSGQDSRGLRSNAIHFGVMLVDSGS